jgi:hypothetical protein
MPNTISIPNDFAVSAHGMTQVIATLPMASIIYLLANGYSQSLGDAGTSAIAKAKLAAVEVANKQRGKGNAMSTAAVAAFLATDAIVALCKAAAIDAKNKRQLALEEGTMVFGTRGPNGPRLSPLDAFCRTQAEADAKAMAARKGKPLPKGDDLETLLAAIIDVHRVDYTQRFEKTEVPAAILDSLFG